MNGSQTYENAIAIASSLNPICTLRPTLAAQRVQDAAVVEDQAHAVEPHDQAREERHRDEHEHEAARARARPRA